MNLIKINKPESLALIAYSALRDSILSFKLQQGQLYNEMSVAQELGLSRTPVREALQRLSSESLITFLPRKGFIVTSFTRQDVEEIFEVRQILESAVVRKITRKVSKNNIDDLRRHINLQDCAAAKNDYHGFMQSDRIFHKTFFDLVDNCRLLNIMDNYQDICHMMGACYLKVNGLYAEAIQDHKAIIESIETRDANMAEAAILQHIAKVKSAVIKTFTAESESVK